MGIQYYSAQVNLSDGGDMITIWHDTAGRPGMPAREVRKNAERYALKQVPGARVIGSRVTTDGKIH
ncbi:hypothetical protein ACF08W_34570 [Streptomyces sp. NPDC015144]|uniref:hypothetical protein n=1 Tax=Streptomyces sp. NPDC015144 TaxID=3364944 RepID=UPI0036FCCCE2